MIFAQRFPDLAKIRVAQRRPQQITRQFERQGHREAVGEIEHDDFPRVARDAQEKMAAGDPLGLAEIVREGALRQRRLRGKGNGSLLSAGERAIYMKARRLLSGEIGLAHGLEPSEAEAWIDRQLGAAA